MPGQPPLLSARTRVAGVIGDPIRQSLSPILHNAAFAARGLDWVYVAFPVPHTAGAAAVDAMRTLGVAGLSVTMPHKAAAARHADRCTPTVARLEVANTLTLVDGEVVADSTDGAGFVEALRHEQGWDPDGRRCVVLGAGGAARAVTLALAEAGAAAVVVVARRPDAAAACAALAGSVGEVGTAAQAADAELVVNATPVGMSPAASTLPMALDPGVLGPGQLVSDLIYVPAVTPLLAEADRRGAATVNGLGMLVHQAASQWATWTGAAPPVDVMLAAATNALAAGTDE